MTPPIKPQYASTVHRDNTVSYWDVYLQQWQRTSIFAIVNTTMKTFDIITDSGSQTIEAETLAEALREWDEAPAKVTTAEAWETWLENLGGFGNIQEDGVVIARVAS